MPEDKRKQNQDLELVMLPAELELTPRAGVLGARPTQRYRGRVRAQRPLSE